MASRRTRIKGIANIPQRRKTNPVESPDDAKRVQNDLNLTSVAEHPEPSIPGSKSEVSGNPPLDEIKEDSEQQDKGVEPALGANVGGAPVVEPGRKLLQRRQFIKPTISLSAINRKSKVTEESTVQNKIVFLSDVIINSDQEPLILSHKGQKDSGSECSMDEEKTFQEETKIEDTAVPFSTQGLLDKELLIPPPSPTKVNRSRIKAIPRLSQRHTSASESEDETRRNNRHRNDSVCSTTSLLQENNSLSDPLSLPKPREFNTLIQRKCRRTDQSRKLAEARRDFHLKFGDKKPDRQKLIMLDLLFYNPTTNLMSDNRNKKVPVAVDEAAPPPQSDELADDPDKVDDEDDNQVPAPQIKIGANGEIVLDEKSLVIENKDVKKGRAEIEKQKVVDGDFETNYGVYKRAKRSKDWSKEDTLKFYKALNTIGTDFTLMCDFFPRRNRRELKTKFKKEERVNKSLIDRAILKPGEFDFNDLQHEVEMEEKELQAIQKQKEKEQEMKKRKAISKKEDSELMAKQEPPKKKRRRKLDILEVLENTSSDESEPESIDGVSENRVLQTLVKATRSGRVPRSLNRYQSQENNGQVGAVEKQPPGSLIVVTETGAHGEPVYKVCMVTEEDNKQQIGNNLNSLTEAIKCKENISFKDLFKITASAVEVGDEHNLTIPADDCGGKEMSVI